MGWPKGKPRNKPSWNAGLSKETSPILASIAAKSSETMKGKTFITSEGRKRLSESVSKQMHERYAAGWQNTGGRCRKIRYESPVAGTIFLDGTWEEVAAKHLDPLGVRWQRNTKRFAYLKENGSRSTYCPDFFVQDWQTYIEIKGYETSLDRLKWSQFPEKLEVWKREKIKTIGR